LKPISATVTSKLCNSIKWEYYWGLIRVFCHFGDSGNNTAFFILVISTSKTSI